MNGLQYIRQELGLTASAIAKKLGVTRSAVSLWEHGKSRMSFDNLKQLSEMLSIPQEYFGEITEKQAQEVYTIIQCNRADAQNEFELEEADKVNSNFKKALLQICEVAKSSTNQYSSFSDFLSNTDRCTKILNQFAEILELYGTDLKLQYCLSAFIRAKKNGTNLTDELKKIIESIVAMDERQKEHDKLKQIPDYDELY